MDVASTKVLAMALLGVFSLILGFIPLKLRRFMGWSEQGKHSRRKNIVTSILLCFGAGVLLATSLIHILPEVREGFSKSCQDFGHIPMAELFFCIGFFIIYLMEELVHAFVPRTPEAELRSTLKRIHSISSSFRRKGSTTPVAKKGDKDETGINICEMKSVNKPEVSLDEVDIQPSPTDKVEGHYPESETPVGSYNPKYRVKLNQSVQKMFPNYHPPDNQTDQRDNSTFCSPKSKMCSVSIRDFMTIAALSFHSVFEGLAVGLEPTSEDVWQLFGAIATHKFVIVFCVGLELATNDTKLGSFISYMVTFSIATPVGIGIGIAITESSLLTDPTHHSMTVNALQGISAGSLLYVVVFEILQRERTKAVPGLLQLFFLILGFTVMIIIENYGGHVHNHVHGEPSSHHHNVCNSTGSFSNEQSEHDHLNDQDHQHHQHMDHDHDHDHDHDLPNPIVHEFPDPLSEPKHSKKNFHPKADPNLSSDLFPEAKIKDKIHLDRGTSPPIFEKSLSKLKGESVSRKISQDAL